MSEAFARMLGLAREALDHAHAPYSRFRVGACVRAASGRLYAGCNVENASYPVGQCAEASAIGAMVTGGDTAIVEVLLLTERAEACSPCGRCRQQLSEFATAATPLHLCGPEGLRQTVTLGQLLPLAFDFMGGPDMAPQTPQRSAAPRPSRGAPRTTP